MLSSIQGMVSNYKNSYWTFCTIIIMSRGRVHLMSVFKKVFAELNPGRVYIIGKKSNFNERTSKCTFITSSLTLSFTLLWFYAPTRQSIYPKYQKESTPQRLILHFFYVNDIIIF
jgi:hypothetical protein